MEGFSLQIVRNRTLQFVDHSLITIFKSLLLRRDSEEFFSLLIGKSSLRYLYIISYIRSQSRLSLLVARLFQLRNVRRFSDLSFKFLNKLSKLKTLRR